MGTNVWSGRAGRTGGVARTAGRALLGAAVFLGILVSFLTGASAHESASGQVVFGPEDLRTPRKGSQTFVRVFATPGPHQDYTVCIDNGGRTDEYPLVSSARVALNGRVIIWEKEFGSKPAQLAREVELGRSANLLVIDMRAPSRSGLTVRVVKGGASQCSGGGAANRAPTFTSSPVLTAAVGQPYGYDADATDADNDPLTYALTTSPSGMTIVPGTGVIAWTPTSAGTFPVVATVSDGRGGSATQSFSVVVPQSNRAPVLTSSPVLTGAVGQAYAYDADATDADNDPLTYALTTLPSGMTIVPGTGVIAWTPTAAGTFPVVVSVSDGRGGSATQSFSIVVPQPNRPPAFTSSPGLTGTVNQAYAYDADATDADNDPLTYALTTSPSGMTIAAGTGAIAWTPTAAGAFPVVVSVSDGRGGVATQSFSIAVPQVSANRPPTAADDHYVVPVGQTMTVPAPALLNNDSDPDGDPLIAAPLSGSAPDKGTLSGPNPDGSFTYEAPSGPTGPAFQPVVRYRAQMDGAYFGHYEVDVTGDGVRDVLVKSGNGFGAFDGPTGAPLWLIGTGIGGPGLPPPYTQPCRVNSGLEGWAVGDIDDDGIPEIVTTANCDPSVYDYDDHLMAFDARTGAEKWVSQRLSVTRNPAAPGVGFTYTNPGAAWAAGVTIARLTPNDVPVILFGNSRNANDCAQYVESAPSGQPDCRRVTIVDGPTGAKRRTMFSIGAAINNRAANADMNETQNFQAPIVFDLDRNGEVEIVYAGVVFALDGSPKWELPVATPHIAVGNLDDTPDVEVVVITKLPPLHRLGNLEAYKSDGSLLWRYPLGNGNTNLFSNLTVADVDGDGFADVLFPYYDYGLAIDMLLVVGHDGRLKWLAAGPATAPNAALSARSRVAVFDLDGDGVPEVIKQHPDALHVLNGVDGTVKASVPFGQLGDLGGSMSVPSVADLDGDGRAEIVAVNAGAFQPDYGVWVVESGGAPWRGVTGGLSQMSSGGAAVSVNGRVPLDAGNPFADRRTNVFGTVAPEPLPSNRSTANETSFFYTVSDGTLSIVAQVTIDIAPQNRPPMFTSTPPQVYTPSSAFSYAAFAVDPDAGDTVTYRIGAIFDQDSVAMGGPGCHIDAASGLLACGFMAYNTGKSPLVQFLLIATDDHGASSSQLVSVVPSTGAPRVPNVIGQPQAAAVSAVTTAGLQVWAVMPVSSGFPAGQVISQTPAGGAVLPVGGLVSLVVSAGPPPVVVPNVVGRQQVVANSTLLSEKLSIGTVTFALSATVADGGIVSQVPTAGTAVPRQTAVDLVVSLGSGVRVTLERSVISAGSAVAITGHVFDASGTEILPTPTLAFVILGSPAAGTPPTVNGATIVTAADTRGAFALRAMLPSSGAYAEASFAVIPGATSAVHSRLSDFSSTLAATERRFARIGELIGANDLVGVAAEAAALRATRTALDLEAIRATPVAAPEEGFLPVLSDVVAAGFGQTMADEAWLRGLTEISTVAERLEDVLNSDSPTRSEVVELQILAGRLHSAVVQVQHLQPTAFGLVAGAGELHEGAAVRIPRLLAAALDRSVSLLQRQGLSASLATPEAMFDGRMAPLVGTPASYYGLARPTFWGGTLGELVPVMGVLSNVIKAAVAATTLYYGFDHAWRSIGLALNPQVSQNMVLEVLGGNTFPTFGYSSLRASVGGQENHPGQYDVLVIGSSAVSAVQNLLATSLGNVRNNSQLTALLDQVKTIARNAGAWQNANAQPTTVTPDGFGLNGCIGNLYCVSLQFAGGITKVNTGLSLLPQPVYIIVRNLRGDRNLAHGLFAFW